ncbi:CAAX amino terminal protease self- immunity [Roseovarius sp. THAF27]|uniref:CPBP family intramembrane glutamic endopeptidase n=1 Tax=Roseovarius sp. THAF27 TaxID=2587850 RepID=UPI0012683945|nr:CPBP family intramembrane glutamic endopeptidase [Roseovarius sp. THAF27]QFT79274.1 CAAX amino terminal protease self- immunity [Roseovarius sp. THAF27]
MSDAYRPFEALVAPARRTASLVRLVLGGVMLAVLFLSTIFAASTLLNLVLPGAPLDETAAALANGGTPYGVLANLYIFGFIILALAITGRAVHDRSLPSFVGDWRRARQHFGRVCLYMVGLHLALSILLPATPDLTPEANLAPSSWLVFLPLALPAILVQTGAEELVFRGYLQSQLAARFANPRIWIIVPAILFGLLHYDPAINGDATWLIVGWATLFGIAAADLTARTGTIGAALGLHFVNNFFAILVAAPAGNFDGLALYTYPFAVGDTDALWVWAPLDLMLLLVSWLTARLALRV